PTSPAHCTGEHLPSVGRRMARRSRTELRLGLPSPPSSPASFQHRREAPVLGLPAAMLPRSTSYENRTMKTTPGTFAMMTLLSAASVACSQLYAEEEHGEHAEHAQHPIVLTSSWTTDVDAAQRYVSQIHASRHIELRALERGYLQQITVQEGQAVRQGQLLFKLFPVVYKAKLRPHEAELDRAQIRLRNTVLVTSKNIVSVQERALAKAARERAKAKVELSSAELSF